MEYVPIKDCFKVKVRVNYPSHQRGELIEEYADRYYRDLPSVNGFTYIPIHWTAWHVNNQYGKQKDACIRELWDLPKGRYFTIAQYDGGTLIDEFLKEKGCVTFVSDCVIPDNIPIPLLCDPHPVYRNESAQFLCTFIGALDTHPIRVKLRDLYAKRAGFFFGRGDTTLFRNFMRESVFCLAPRGSGITSFRMYEAMQMGCIPIYISDMHRCPFDNKVNWDDVCVRLTLDEVHNVEKIIRAIPATRIKEMQSAMRKACTTYFNMKGTCDEVLNILRTL